MKGHFQRLFNSAVLIFERYRNFVWRGREIFNTLERPIDFATIKVITIITKMILKMCLFNLNLLIRKQNN